MYVLSGGLLFYAGGPLALPGVLCVIMCIVFVLRKKYYIAAAISSIAAATSYLLQYNATCAPCILSATMLALSTVTVALKDKRLLILCLLPLASAGIMYYNTQAIQEREIADAEASFNKYKITENSVMENKETWVTETEENKMLLYFSPTCKSCPDALREMIDYDPQGRYWTPVVVPERMIVEGRIELVRLGYTGQKYYSAPASPNGGTPCLADGSRYIVGVKSIRDHLKNWNVLQQKERNGEQTYYRN